MTDTLTSHPQNRDGQPVSASAEGSEDVLRATRPTLSTEGDPGQRAARRRVFVEAFDMIVHHARAVFRRRRRGAQLRGS